MENRSFLLMNKIGTSNEKISTFKYTTNSIWLYPIELAVHRALAPLQNKKCN